MYWCTGDEQGENALVKLEVSSAGDGLARPHSQATRAGTGPLAHVLFLSRSTVRDLRDSMQGLLLLAACATWPWEPVALSASMAMMV